MAISEILKKSHVVRFGYGPLFCSVVLRLNLVPLESESTSRKQSSPAEQSRAIHYHSKNPSHPAFSGKVRNAMRQVMAEGSLRKDFDVDTAIDLLHGPLYYRLVLGTGRLDKEFIERKPTIPRRSSRVRLVTSKRHCYASHEARQLMFRNS